MVARRFGGTTTMLIRDLLQARANECRQFANLARDPDMRERWLGMAEEWLRLAQAETRLIEDEARLAD